MHRLLERQLKRALGFSPEQWAELSGRLPALADGLKAGDPALAALLAKLPTLLERVGDSYSQSERDLALIRRGLELSSAELTEANQRLLEEANTSSRALHALEGTFDTLLKDLGRHRGSHSQDLGDIAEEVAHLTREWRAMQEALAKSEERFNLAMQGANDGLWDWDLVNQRIYYSPRWKAMIGHDEDDIGDGLEEWSGRVHPEDLEQALAAVKDYLKGETDKLDIVFRFRHKDGHYLYILSRGLAVRDASGRATRMVGTHTDVSTRMELERHLAQFKSALDAHAIVSITDAAGRITYANKHFLAISGYQREELLGHTHRMVKSGVHPPAFYEDMWRAISSGQVWRGEVCNRKKSGEQYWVMATIAPMLDANGLPTHYIAIRADITQVKQAEAAMRQAKEAAEAANRAKSEFLANMSHEIRTPMNGVLGMLGLALGTDLDEEQKEYLELAQSSAESLLTVINDILDFSKIEAGRLDIHHEDFDLRRLVGEVGRLFRSRCKDKGLGFEMAVQDDVPAMLNGDAIRIRQVLVNLLGNAVKFTDRGGVALAVSLRDRQWLRIAVRDTGIGIPPDKQAAVFSAFTQADGSITRRFGGTGLGLTISNRLVQLMGGERMYLTSEAGAGSEFYFELPLAQGGAAAPYAAPLAVAAQERAHLRILLAEDDAINQRLAVALLGRAGHSVGTAESGLDTLAALEREAFDLVLMDMQMPEMDGLETTRRIRARESELGLPRIPIVALTANAFESDRRRCLEAGMDDFISKPLRKDDLLKCVDRHGPRVGSS